MKACAFVTMKLVFKRSAAPGRITSRRVLSSDPTDANLSESSARESASLLQQGKNWHCQEAITLRSLKKNSQRTIFSCQFKGDSTMLSRHE
jgi:hypothetical protein